MLAGATPAWIRALGSASLFGWMPDDPLQLPLDLVPRLPGRFGVRRDSHLHGRRGLHGQPVLPLLCPGRAFQLDEFICQFDCHGPDDTTTRIRITRCDPQQETSLARCGRGRFCVSGIREGPISTGVMGPSKVPAPSVTGTVLVSSQNRSQYARSPA